MAERCPSAGCMVPPSEHRPGHVHLRGASSIPEHVIAFAAGLMTFAPAAVSARRPGGVPAAVAAAVAHMGLGAFDPAELIAAADAWVQRNVAPPSVSPPAAAPRPHTWAPCGRCGCGALSHAASDFGNVGPCLTSGCGCESFA